MIETLSVEPIELSFLEICREKSEFVEYYYIYQATKIILKKHYFPFINDVNPHMTDHGIGHIERILSRLFYLLKPHLLTGDVISPLSRKTINSDKMSKKLNAYELYLLLCSVLWHDIGNLYGRNDHEKKIFKLFDKAKGFLYDRNSSEWIEKICKAHSGTNAIENNIERETLNEGEFTFHPRFLAALLRFADELDEDKYRIGERIYDEIPEEKKGYWFFCKCNDSIKIEEDDYEKAKIVIEGRIDKGELFSVLKKETTIGIIDVKGLEEYLNRIDKINSEMTYCGYYFKPHFFKALDKIELRLRIYDGNECLEDLFSIFDSRSSSSNFFANHETILNKHR